MISDVLGWLIVLFPVSEVTLALVKRARRVDADASDRGSLRMLWISICGGVALAVWARLTWRGAVLPGPLHVREAIALACMAIGLAIRWTAIVTLGRYFTVDVATQRDQTVVQHGPYRFVRHPSYAGLLLTFIGLGIAYGTWPSLVLLILPIVPALVSRMGQEEAVLESRLGAPYREYCARTKRLVPGLY